MDVLRRISGPCALAVSVGGSACGDDSVLVLAHEAVATPVRADASAGALAALGADDDTGMPGAGAGASRSGAAAADAGSVKVPPRRELELPSWWAESVAAVCRDDDALCAGGACPTFADSLERLRMDAKYAARDYCVSEAGVPHITLKFEGIVEAYRAGSGELVSRLVTSDVPDYCYDTVPTNRQVTGSFIEDCLWVRDNPRVDCTDVSAPDLSSFDNCTYDFRR